MVETDIVHTNYHSREAFKKVKGQMLQCKEERQRFAMSRSVVDDVEGSRKGPGNLLLLIQDCTSFEFRGVDEEG